MSGGSTGKLLVVGKLEAPVAVRLDAGRGYAAGTSAFRGNGRECPK